MLKQKNQIQSNKQTNQKNQIQTNKQTNQKNQIQTNKHTKKSDTDKQTNKNNIYRQTNKQKNHIQTNKQTNKKSRYRRVRNKLFHSLNMKKSLNRVKRCCQTKKKVLKNISGNFEHKSFSVSEQISFLFFSNFRFLDFLFLQLHLTFFSRGHFKFPPFLHKLTFKRKCFQSVTWNYTFAKL